MDTCNSITFVYPLYADIYYPEVQQGSYGAVSKAWTLDRVTTCNFAAGGRRVKEELDTNINMSKDVLLLGRVRSDLRVTSLGQNKAMTNILVTNIRDEFQVPIYTETSGPRIGLSTLFEIATHEPQLGPFGTVDFYKVILRRSENQGIEL